MAAPADIDITYTRGDSAPIPFKVTDPDTGLAINITGFQYVLTVNPDPDPADASGHLMTVTGTITDGPNGLMEFRPTTSDSDFTPAVYFYDVQQTDGAPRIQTVAAGRFTLRQDITKT